jgi:hypothetical protein
MASRPSERTSLLVVGQRVRDELGHWCEVSEVVGRYHYKVKMLQELNGTLYPYGYGPILCYRSDLRADGE